VVKRLLNVLNLKAIWMVLAGFLPGVVIGGVIAILGVFLLAPQPNLPPPEQDNSPGDVTIQLSQSFLNTIASQKVNGVGLPVPGNPQLQNAHAQPRSGDQLLITGDVQIPITGTRQVMIDLQPCVSSKGKPAFMVTGVFLGGVDITGQAGQSVQESINNGFNGVNLNVPNEHLSRIQTTPNALILIYGSGSGQGQPACQGI